MRPIPPQSAFGRADARTANCAVQRPERAYCRIDGGSNVVLLGDIGVHKPRATTECVGQLLPNRIVHIGHNDPSARRGKAPHARRPQARGAPSDQKDMSIELHLQQRTGDRASGGR